MTSTQSENYCCLILFGATGDLSRRMLLPSLYHLHREDKLDACLRIIASARSQMTGDEFRVIAADSIRQFVPERDRDEDSIASFLPLLDYVSVDVQDQAAFAPLAAHEFFNQTGDVLIYLSTSPSFYGPICDGLNANGLVTPHARVVMEKPIGHDLASSEEINDAVTRVFPETSVFRIDHYLGKETVQNLIALRFANSLFEPLWDGEGIDHIQITLAEQVGLEGRWSYYDKAGALRDMVQNHMLQLLCLVAMEPPSHLEPDAVRNEKVKVLRSLRPITGADVGTHVVRGQYSSGIISGNKVPGYWQEEGADTSDTETFVAIRAHVDNWRWKGVPFYLRTGKRLTTRRTEILIQFKPVPHSIFGTGSNQALSPNRMVIRLQPEESVRMEIMTKVPGLDDSGGMHLQSLPLDLSLHDNYGSERRRIAYERLLLDAIRNNGTLFVRRDEVEAAWKWIDGIVDGWKAGQGVVHPYSAGSWGPDAAAKLLGEDGRQWGE